MIDRVFGLRNPFFAVFGGDGSARPLPSDLRPDSLRRRPTGRVQMEAGKRSSGAAGGSPRDRLRRDWQTRGDDAKLPS